MARGHITKRGDAWTAVVDLPPDPATGKRRQKRITARTKKEVEARVAEVIASIERGAFADPGKLTVRDAITHYLATADLAPNSRRAYEGAARRIVLPRIGGVPLAKLTGRQITELYVAVRGTGYGALVQAVVTGALRLAVREGVLARNPAEGFAVPRDPRPERRERCPWTPADLTAFLAAAQSHWLAPVYWLLAHTGLRLSEALGLRWENVSLDLGRLFVAQSKTPAGRRRVSLDPATVAVLRRHAAEQARRRAALGPDWQEHGLVFDRGDGRPVSPRTVEEVMSRLARRAGLPHATPHTLRHLHATVLLTAGVPPHVVMARLGHSSFRVTVDHYAHVLPTSERDAATIFAAAVRDQSVTTVAGEAAKPA